MADFGDLRYFCRGLWVGDCDGEAVDVGRGPLGIAMGFQVFGVEGNGVLVSCCLADFLDSL